MTDLPIRRPVVAGQFYPDNRDVLEAMIQDYLDRATLSRELGQVRAVIAPHAGYVYSGPIAGYAFKGLAALPEKQWTVFLLGPSHRSYFSGVALGNYAAFRTPLGDVPVASKRVADFVERSALFVHGTEAHAYEHCLEVELPFLQVALPVFQLVPMLFGSVDPRRVAALLAESVTEDDLIVVSSDLSHYFPYEKARELDGALLGALLEGEQERVMTGEACGRAPIVTLMEIARGKGWQPHVLDCRNSGDTAGDKRQVVGYASVAYTSAQSQNR